MKEDNVEVKESFSVSGNLFRGEKSRDTFNSGKNFHNIESKKFEKESSFSEIRKKEMKFDPKIKTRFELHPVFWTVS